MKKQRQQPVISACSVVGIGTSAGGLKALKELLAHLPGKTGMAYVVIQHLDPTHLSLLPELLAQVTSLPIREIQEGMVAEPDGVYICPPNAELTLTQRAFQLKPFSLSRKKSSQSGIIDGFFTSLAHEWGEDAVGVILSGTGSDGTMGLQAIQTTDGITFAQDPAAALFPQMPQSAIEAECVDYVLTCEEIAHALVPMLSHRRHGRQAQPFSVLEKQAPEHDFTGILHLLSAQSRVDFRSYKPATLQRRIASRMALLRLAPLSAYTAYLRDHPDEVEALMQSVLIAVTDFFRDPVVFDALTRLVWPTLLAKHQESEPLRIWVPGCATGEEAYSLAMSLHKFLQVQKPEQRFQIFASDVNPTKLAVARTGIYEASALAAVSKEYREQYFLPVDQQPSCYRLDTRIRECCVFAPHDLLRDPPFGRLDMISCRNVLIYLQASFQVQILQTFHYALLSEGFLLLGMSESTEPLSRLFHQCMAKVPLYCKQAIGSILLPQVEKNQEKLLPLTHTKGDPVMREERSVDEDIQQQADRLRLTHYVSASVVLNANQEIVQVRGQTDLYLQLTGGHITLNVLRMVRPGLTVGLRAALQAACKEYRTIIHEDLYVSAFGITRRVRITVSPLKGPPAGHYCLVVFEEQERLPDELNAVAKNSVAGERKEKRDRAQRRIAGLEQEVISLQSEMQAILQERDTTCEELQAANEELQASNEELKSLNEEMETSKEELQTINEELGTANQELATRNEQLKAAQEYAESIVETVRSPLIVLSEQLRVKYVNAAFYQFFQVAPQETEGTLLYALGNGQWNIPHLRTLLEEVLPANGFVQDFEVTHHFPQIGSKTLLLNARRLPNQPSQSPLILLVMEDITERRATERHVQARLAFLQHLLDALPNSIYLVQGEDARLVLANRATRSLWGAPWTIGQPMQDFLQSNQIHIFDPQGNVLPPASFAAMCALSEGKTVFQHQQIISHADGTTLPVLVNAVPIEDMDPSIWIGAGLIASPSLTALVVHQDVTPFKEAEELKDRFLGLVAHELRTPLTTIKGYARSLLMESTRDLGCSLVAWQQEAVAEIDLSADLLTRLTNDLLDVVRLQGRRLVIYPEPLNLVTLTQRLVGDLQRTTERHQITLSLIPESLNELLALADKDRIQQVLSNLLTNAIKYSPHGGKIKVILRKEEQGTVLMSIRDQGIGIPQAEQACLFARFARASNGEAHRISGTGLGLYLCRELVLQHQGQIWFESREEAGSTFFVRLSLISDLDTSDAQEQVPTLSSVEEKLV